MRRKPGVEKERRKEGDLVDKTADLEVKERKLLSIMVIQEWANC